MACFGREARDQTDYPPRPMRPSALDIACLIIAIVFHIFDLGTDIKVTFHYYSLGEMYYVTATIAIVIIPSIVTSCVSYRMYTMDRENEVSYLWNRKMKLRIVMLVFQLAPVLRYVDSLKYAYKSRKAEQKHDKEEQEKYYKLMLKEDADVALLRVFESFLESAPQQVLQINYLLKSYYQNIKVDNGYTGYDPYLSAGSSFAGMALCLMTYQKSIRYVQEDKDNISCKGSVFIFLWHFFVTISRILMLSAMVLISWKYALLSIVIHWIVMTVCLSILESHDFCTNTSSIEFQKLNACETFANFLYSSVLGLVYIFTYITPGDGSTRLRYTGFYVTCLIENIVGAMIWYYYTDISWLSILMTTMCVVPFVIGVLCMIIYHWKFHPRQYIPPSFMPQRRQVDLPECSRLSVVASPKTQAEHCLPQNGFVTHEIGDIHVS